MQSKALQQKGLYLFFAASPPPLVETPSRSHGSALFLLSCQCSHLLPTYLDVHTFKWCSRLMCAQHVSTVCHRGSSLEHTAKHMRRRVETLPAVCSQGLPVGVKHPALQKQMMNAAALGFMSAPQA